jgi:hypothetical protein
MEDIEQLLKTFRIEVATASQAFYAWKSINNIAFSSTKIHDALNKNALSWNIITHSLQSTFFITLGRLFDTDGDSFSVHAFLRACIDNIDQFSKDALRTRKMKDQNGHEPPWLNQYIKDAYVPLKKDFLILRGETSKKQKLYEDIYRPIRNQIIAHKDKLTIDNIDELFSKTKTEQIEDILQFLYQIEMVVFNLLANGKITQLGNSTSDEETYVHKDIKDLLIKFASDKAL